MSDLFLSSALTLVLGILYLGLIIHVILVRRAGRIAYGDGGDKRLRGAIRAQVNAGEQLPLFLIAFALCEWREMPDAWLMLMALTLIVGRIFNAYGMAGLAHRFRVYGTALNLSAFIFVLATLAWSLI